jgi:mRNA interferase MazF
MIRPSRVVLALFPGVVQTKVRPCVVVSTDTYHATRQDVILALLTTVLAGANQPSDYILQDWAVAGLHQRSAFRAFLQTLPVRMVERECGDLSPRDWQEVQSRLRVAVAVT